MAKNLPSNDVDDDDLDLKSYMAKYGMVEPGELHHRIYVALKAKGIPVYTITRSLLHPHWEVTVHRRAEMYAPSLCALEFFHTALRDAGIHLSAKDIYLRTSGKRMKVSFPLHGGDPGMGIKYSRESGGRIEKCREFYSVPAGF